MYDSPYMWKSCSEPTPYGPHIDWRGVMSVQGGILADYDQIDTNVLKRNPAQFGYPKTFELHVIKIFLQNFVLMLHIRRWPSWRHVSSGQHIGCLRPKFLVGGSTLLTKFQLPQRPGNYVLLTLYVEILFWSKALRDPILTDVVSQQFRAAYWRITTKLIFMSWGEILPSLVILSLLTFEIHVIEILLHNFAWCYISVGGHPGVMSVHGGILADYDQNLSRGWDSLDTKFLLPQWPGNYVPHTSYVEILFSANAL